jgi:hypothetical protein
MVLRISGFVMQDENDVLTALRRLEEMHISVEALKVKIGFRVILFSLPDALVSSSKDSSVTHCDVVVPLCSCEQ